MGRHVAVECPELDAKINEACRAIGAEIDALKVPALAGVVLGGGYGRGEGGIGEDSTLSNDLDFFAITEDGAPEAESIASIMEALQPVSEKWAKKLGVDVDFAAKTPWRLKHDESRLMVQELLRGYFDVSGKKGEELFSHIERRSADGIPWNEAARLLMNRGVGLLLARDRSGRERFGFEDMRGDFAARNVNKCVLGSGDARLVARHDYRWRALERADALGDDLYREAVEWKFRPKADAVCSWDAAREAWLSAEEEVMERGKSEGGLSRSLREAARWIVRGGAFGDISGFGQDCTVRVLRRVGRAVKARAGVDEALMREWKTFN